MAGKRCRCNWEEEAAMGGTGVQGGRWQVYPKLGDKSGETLSQIAAMMTV